MKKIPYLALFVLLTAFNAHSAPWSQTFNESGVGTFDEWAVFMKEGTVLFTGAWDYSSPGWSDHEDPSFIFAQGPDTSNMNFNIGFSDGTPFKFDFFAFDNTPAAKILREGAIASWDNGWSFQVLDNQSALRLYDTDMAANAPVPEPASMLLFGTGVAGLGYLRTRKRKRS